MQGTLSVSIWRGGEAGSFQPYEVPRRDNQTVLDVVTYVQRKLDGSLSYRFACRVGMCGSCAMMVNGRPRWTCRTHVSRVASSGKLTIAPLRNLPVIKDLTVDMTDFFDKWAKAGGAFKPTATRADDFLRGRGSSDTPETSYLPGLTPSDLREVLDVGGIPVAARLREGLRRFERRMPGYGGHEAVLVGVESRTSAPVRVPRDGESLESPDLQGLYPTGEGAGYAGGIVSAAIDGIRVARAVTARVREL